MSSLLSEFESCFKSIIDKLEQRDWQGAILTYQQSCGNPQALPKPPIGNDRYERTAWFGEVFQSLTGGPLFSNLDKLVRTNNALLAVYLCAHIMENTTENAVDALQQFVSGLIDTNWKTTEQMTAVASAALALCKTPKEVNNVCRLAIAWCCNQRQYADAQKWLDRAVRGDEMEVFFVDMERIIQSKHSK